MATCTRTLLKVLGCQRWLLGASRPPCLGVPQISQSIHPVRTFAAFKAQKKEKKDDKAEEKKKKPRIVVDDADRHKPYGKTAWTPVDDVYILRYYPRTIHNAGDAIDMLKHYQKLDFTAENQPLCIDLLLNMKLEKKKKVDTFVSTVHLPHPFKTEINKVLVFTEDSDQAELALKNGAAFAGGVELIQPILDDEVSADFYIAVPDMLQKLLPLKNKLRKKFPKSKRGSVGINVSKMLALFKTGHEYMVESECYIRTQIGTLDMPKDHLYANLEAIIVDVCSHRPANMGPFVERAIMASHTSEAVWFNSQDVLPKQAEEEQED